MWNCSVASNLLARIVIYSKEELHLTLRTFFVSLAFKMLLIIPNEKKEKPALIARMVSIMNNDIFRTNNQNM